MVDFGVQEQDFIEIHQEPKKIFLFLIRHGESEANVSTMFKKALFPNHDPNLTDKGIFQALKLRIRLLNCFKNILHRQVFTSVLVRAQETALIAFPNDTIKVVDHLKEKTNIHED